MINNISNNNSSFLGGRVLILDTDHPNSRNNSKYISFKTFSNVLGSYGDSLFVGNSSYSASFDIYGGRSTSFIDISYKFIGSHSRESILSNKLQNSGYNRYYFMFSRLSFSSSGFNVNNYIVGCDLNLTFSNCSGEFSVDKGLASTSNFSTKVLANNCKNFFIGRSTQIDNYSSLVCNSTIQSGAIDTTFSNCRIAASFGMVGHYLGCDFVDRVSIGDGGGGNWVFINCTFHRGIDFVNITSGHVNFIGCRFYEGDTGLAPLMTGVFDLIGVVVYLTNCEIKADTTTYAIEKGGFSPSFTVYKAFTVFSGVVTGVDPTVTVSALSTL